MRNATKKRHEPRASSYAGSITSGKLAVVRSTVSESSAAGSVRNELSPPSAMSGDVPPNRSTPSTWRSVSARHLAEMCVSPRCARGQRQVGGRRTAKKMRCIKTRPTTLATAGMAAMNEPKARRTRDE